MSELTPYSHQNGPPLRRIGPVRQGLAARACGDSGQVVALGPGLGIVRAVPCIRRDGRVVEGARLERV